MIEHKYKIAVVNYLNTKPFIAGLVASDLADEIQIIETSPAHCASLYTNQTVDISLVPVGALLHQSFDRISDLGIASDGPVSSVCVCSEVPVQDIKSVFLDYQSRTSVLLTQILFKQYWKQTPLFIHSSIGYESQIRGNTAGLIIGDRALQLKSNYKYVYDLGQAWQHFSSLPFTYAVWCAGSSLPLDFIHSFNKALTQGIDQIPDLILNLQPSTTIDLSEYYTKNIQYQLTPTHLLGMDMFLKEASFVQTRADKSFEKAVH